MAGTKPTYVVIGTGADGHAIAAEIGLRGIPLVVADIARNSATIEVIQAQGGLICECEIDSFAGGRGQHLAGIVAATTDIGTAVAEAKVVILATEPTAIETILQQCAGQLRNDQVLLLCPGGVGGALIARKIASDHGAPSILSGQISKPYTQKLEKPGTIRITERKKAIPLGVFPASRTAEVLEGVIDVFPQLRPGANVIASGLNRAGIGLHPVPMIMNAAKIEQSGPFIYDAYDITPAMGKVIESVDAERQAILRALGTQPGSFIDVLNRSFGVTGATFYDAVHKVESYKHAKSPGTVNHTYLTDDIPTQVVPAAELGMALGIATPLLDAIIAFGSAMVGADYRKEGWNLEKLGMSGMGRQEILRFIETGERMPKHSAAVR